MELAQYSQKRGGLEKPLKPFNLDAYSDSKREKRPRSPTLQNATPNPNRVPDEPLPASQLPPIQTENRATNEFSLENYAASSSDDDSDDDLSIIPPLIEENPSQSKPPNGSLSGTPIVDMTENNKTSLNDDSNDSDESDSDNSDDSSDDSDEDDSEINNLLQSIIENKKKQQVIENEKNLEEKMKKGESLLELEPNQASGIQSSWNSDTVFRFEKPQVEKRHTEKLFGKYVFR